MRAFNAHDIQQGSVDKHDQTKLREESARSTDDTAPKVPDSKLENTEGSKQKGKGDTVTGPGTQRYPTNPHTSSEPGVVGKFQTIGSTEAAGGVRVGEWNRNTASHE